MNPKNYRYYTYIRPVLRNKVVKTYSSLVFSLIAVAVFGVFALKPTFSTIIQLQTEINQQHQVLDQITTKVNNLATARKNYQQIPAEKINRLDNLIPNQTALSNIVIDLDGISQLFQVTVSGINVKPLPIIGPTHIPTKDSKVAKVEFSFNAQGAYSQLVSFIDSLQTYDRLMTINSVTITKNNAGTLIMNVSGEAYFIK